MRTLFVIAAAGFLLSAGCDLFAKKKSATKPTTPAPTAEASAPAAGSGTNTNYQPGAGAVSNVRQAARRTVALNDMHQLGVAIQQMYTLDGTMPDRNRIIAEIRTFGSIAAAVNEGAIILTGSNDPNGLWAYEFESDVRGGIVLVAGSARRADAQEVKQLLGRR